MKLSSKARYAVMALVDLTQHAHEGPVPLVEMGERQNISLVYLEQIFMKLRKAGIVKSARGVKGGYVLARDPHQLNLAEVMHAVGELTPITRCASQGGCASGGKCTTHDFWEGLEQHIETYLESVSLHSIAYSKKCASIVADFGVKEHHVHLS